MIAGSLTVALAACANSSQVVTGTPRAPISPDQVRVYTHAPVSFEEIAILGASRKSLRSGGERAIAKMIDNFKTRAATLGANGVLLEDFSDDQGLSMSTGASSESYTHNGSIDLAVGSSVGIVKKTAKGRAIFVPVN